MDIVEYLESKGLTVKPGGSDNIRVLCPFHDEEEGKAGRLYINVEDGEKYGVGFCFRCNWKGNINSIRRHFGDEPIEEYNNRHEYDPIMEQATQYYHEKLFENYEAFMYIEDRAIPESSILRARLGWADGGLGTHLLQKGWMPEQLKNHPLFRIDGSDYFNNQIIFPYMIDGVVQQLRGKAIGGKTISLKGVSTLPYNIDSIRGEKTVALTEGECYPGETEVLTLEGWVKFSELGDQKVAQVNNDLSISFVTPLAKIKKHFSGDLIRYKNAQRYDSVTTPKHKVVGLIKDSKGNLKWTEGNAEGGLAEKTYAPRVGYIHGHGLNMSEMEIRFRLAIAADFTVREDRRKDGSWNNRFYCHAGFKKQRKIDAICEVLDSLGIEYLAVPGKGDNNSDYTYVHFSCPEEFSDPEHPLHPSKELPWGWINETSLEQKMFILKEQSLWDGNSVPNRNQLEFSSAKYSEAVWMQTMASMAGVASTIMHRSNQYGEWYKVSILFDKAFTSWQSLKPHREYVPHDGNVYCVTVPSGKLMVRHNGCIHVNGNCDALSLEALGYNVVGIPGVHSFKEDWLAYVEDAKRIYVLFDQDNAGKSGAEKVAQLIGPRARIVELPKKGIDVNDFIVKMGKTRDDFEFLFSKAKGGLLVNFTQAFEQWSFIEGNPQLAGRKFNIKEFDDAMTFGLLPGQVVTMIARSNAGKTQSTINHIHRMRMADSNIKILFYSLEMTRNELFERMHRVHNFYQPGASPIDTVNYWKDNIQIVDKNRINETQMIDCIEQFAYEVDQPPDLIIVDYLGYYAKGFPGQSEKDKVSDAIMGMKSLAKEFQTTFLAPHQANRTGDLGRELTMDMAKDAATVEETSDLMLSLWNPSQEHIIDDENRGEAGIIYQRILKARDSGVGTVCKYAFSPLTLALVPSSDPLYDRAVYERTLAATGHTWRDAVERYQTNSKEI